MFGKALLLAHFYLTIFTELGGPTVLAHGAFRGNGFANVFILILQFMCYWMQLCTSASLYSSCFEQLRGVEKSGAYWSYALHDRFEQDELIILEKRYTSCNYHSIGMSSMMLTTL